MKEQLNIKNYLINTYLYIALSLAIVAFSWLCMFEYNIDVFKNNEILKILLIFIASLITLYYIITTNNNKMVLKNTIWTIFIILISILSFVFFKINIANNTLKKTLIELFVIIIVFTIIAFKMDHTVFLKWEVPLFYSLFAMIIIELVNMIFFKSKYIFFTSWIIVILFMGFLLYDTQKIINNGMIITNLCPSKNQFICADYPKESIGIFLDILNLFERITIINY